jgi:hypothetical protein
LHQFELANPIAGKNREQREHIPGRLRAQGTERDDASTGSATRKAGLVPLRRTQNWDFRE